jgi:hypothetical protein
MLSDGSCTYATEEQVNPQLNWKKRKKNKRIIISNLEYMFMVLVFVID